MNKFEAESVIKDTIEYANQEIAKTKKKTRRTIAVLTVGFALILAGLLLWKPKSTIDIFVVGTAIADMSVEDIKVEGESTYALLKLTDPNITFGINHYFNEGRWVKLAEHFEADRIKSGVTYSSISIQFVIPKETAQAHEWISSDTLSVDLVLRDKDYDPDSLWIVDLME